jgi:Holliday junction resolvasome RuvABC endonuclease subunit
MKKIEILSKLEVKNYTVYNITPPMEITKFSTFIGIDPGSVNLGIAEIVSLENISIRVFQIKLERKQDPVERIWQMKQLLNALFTSSTSPILSKMCIEGASYRGPGRHEELAEIRTVCALWGIENRYNPKIIPPASIRKQVFGTAKFLPQKEWTEIPGDAANALACAYCAMLI